MPYGTKSTHGIKRPLDWCKREPGQKFGVLNLHGHPLSVISKFHRKPLSKMRMPMPKWVLEGFWFVWWSCMIASDWIECAHWDTSTHPTPGPLCKQTPKPGLWLSLFLRTALRLMRLHDSKQTFKGTSVWQVASSIPSTAQMDVCLNRQAKVNAASAWNHGNVLPNITLLG